MWWTKTKSAILSLVCTRTLIGVIIAIAIVFPFLFTSGSYGRSSEAGILYINMPTEMVLALFICAYACFVPAMIALLSLDALLRNIRKDVVFSRVNVKYLRVISWCCFAIAIVMLCGVPFIPNLVLIFVAVAAAFFGLLIRVIKNVIDAACEIKDENDFTI